MMKLPSVGTWLRLVAILCSAPELSAQTRFHALGYLDAFGPTSEANAVTPDGTRIVGYSTTSLTDNLACWWTSEGIQAIPGVQNWHANTAFDISSDGSVIVGNRSFGGTEEAFFWTPESQLQLVPFPAPRRASSAVDVTGDGRVLVGTVTEVHTVGLNSFKVYRAFRWDRDEPTATYLPPYLDDIQNSGGFAVSDDGRRVVGVVQTSLSTQAAARWENGGAPILLNDPSDVTVAITATGITPDGNVVVGTGASTITGKGVGFVWTEAGGVEALPNPTTGFHAIDSATALDISGDGRVIVGYGATVAGRDEAIFWVDRQPYRVSDVALAAGVLPPSWEPFRAHATDYNGNTICGYGQATSGKIEAFALIIDETPEPTEISVPELIPSFAADTGVFSIRYNTMTGVRYRVLGGTSPGTLAPLGDWVVGTGLERRFDLSREAAGGSTSFFLRVEATVP